MEDVLMLIDRLTPRAPVTIPPDSRRTFEYDLDERGGTPVRLEVPEACRKGVRIANVLVRNQGSVVPFFSGREFFAELFDGALVDGEPRDRPYGVLPRVPADPGSVIEVVAWNTTLEKIVFTADLLVERACL